MSAVQEWIRVWKSLKSGERFPGDDEYFDEVEREVRRSRRRDFALKTDDLEPERSGRFHLRLGAVPYVGNVAHARIFILMINPTAGPADYADLCHEGTQQLYQSNQRQELIHCFALSEQTQRPLGWVPYYRDRVFGLLMRGLDESDRRKLHKYTAILELVPYYSQEATLIRDLEIVEGRNKARRGCEEPSHLRKRGLPSAQLAIQAVREIASDHDNLLIPRWKDGKHRWNLAAENRDLKPTIRAQVAEWDRRGSGLPLDVHNTIADKLKEIPNA